METNLLILIPGLLAMIALTVFFVIRNQKDNKEFMRKLIQEDKGSIPSLQETEFNSVD